MYIFSMDEGSWTNVRSTIYKSNMQRLMAILIKAFKAGDLKNY